MASAPSNMSAHSPILEKFLPLSRAIFEGNMEACHSETDALLSAGVSPEEIVIQGLEKSMEALDEKCTVNQFNLLEIMLAGRG
jgi:dimethylamine corrinoid protein